jgi:sugar transferase (PEP-CTERM/EpsH1 system associated)
MVPYPPISGVLARCYNLLREIGRHHEVHLVTFNQRILLPGDEDLRQAVEVLSKHCADVRVLELPHDDSRWRQTLAYGRNVFSDEPYWFPRFRSPAFAALLARTVAEKGIDLVQYETIAVAPYAEALSRLPRVLVHQNVESDLLRRRSRVERNPALKLFFRLHGRRMAGYEARYRDHFDAQVVVSEGDRALLLRGRQDPRVVVVPNGVDTDYFSPGQRPEGARPELIFVGGMSWYPNSDAMAWFLGAIWPRILARVPDARLTVVGSHPSDALRSAAARDPGHVRATDLVPDIRPLVHDAALFVCPFRVGGGTRLKILDAWAMGKAVIATSVGCEGLRARSGADLVVADTPEAFAERAVELLADTEARRRLGRCGRARVETEYAWPRVARHLLDLYERLAAPS